MRPADSILQSGWRAELELRFARRGERTVLAERRHDGPLVVQKPLYPEGDAVCHCIVVHPPAGVAGGDELRVDARLAPGANALLTTPGAGKWYRSAGPWASQRLAFDVAAGAVLEWLPQETILFDGALARLDADVRLQGDAAFVGWEVLCLGRTGSGERLTRGRCRIATRLRRDGRLLWFESGAIDGGGTLLQSPAGLRGRTVCGTLLAASPALDGAALDACRKPAPREGEGAVTLLPGLLVARFLGDSGEAARAYFAALWHVLRPRVAAREAQDPRIWRT